LASLKQITKSLINSMPGPVALAFWDTLWSLKNPAFREQSRRQRKVFARLGKPERLLAGPFAGMRYLNRATGSAYLPKIVGTYELEIMPALTVAIVHRPDLIVDVGSAEGYYAVGLALRLPTARIIAYDIHKPARYLLRSLASKNQVLDRVDIRSACTPATLEADLARASRPMVICDCEGYEDDLLKPAPGSNLARAMVLVELHEMFRPGVGSRLRERFAPTHEVTEMHSRDRTANDLPAGHGLSGEDVHESMNERRAAPMQWLYLRPRQTRA
jgi:hypothetical protein